MFDCVRVIAKCNACIDHNDADDSEDEDVEHVFSPAQLIEFPASGFRRNGPGLPDPQPEMRSLIRDNNIVN